MIVKRVQQINVHRDKPSILMFGKRCFSIPRGKNDDFLKINILGRGRKKGPAEI